MRRLLCIILFTAGFCVLRADTPDAPAGLLILKAVPGYDAAATAFVKIEWLDRYSGDAIDKAGNKTPFLSEAIGRVIYFDQTYYEEIDHNQDWIDWRISVRSREMVLPPVNTLNLGPQDQASLDSETAVFQDTMDRFPISRDLITPLIATIADERAKLSSGLVLQNGNWIAAKDAVAIASSVPVVGDAESPVTFTTKDGKTFTKAKVTITDTGLSVLTEDGGASIAFDQLPDNLSAFPKTVQAKIAAWKKKNQVVMQQAAAQAATEDSGFFSEAEDFVEKYALEAWTYISSFGSAKTVDSAAAPGAAPATNAAPASPAKP